MKYVVTLKISYLDARFIFDDMTDAINFMATAVEHEDSENRDGIQAAMTVRKEEE